MALPRTATGSLVRTPDASRVVGIAPKQLGLAFTGALCNVLARFAVFVLFLFARPTGGGRSVEVDSAVGRVLPAVWHCAARTLFVAAQAAAGVGVCASTAPRRGRARKTPARNRLAQSGN